jgi:glycerol-3-phosphate acyltransferase PlsY
MTLSDLLVVAAAYVVGSLPMGLLVGRLRGVDVRRHGSGNIGATNVGRVLGRRWFLVVFALDFGKSFGPVLVARRLAVAFDGGLAPDQLGLAAGIAAVLGHVFPLFLRFKGGKGVATAAGVFAALAWAPAAAALVAFLAVFLSTRYVSLASIVAAVVLPVACFALPAIERRLQPDHFVVDVDPSVSWASVLVGALIVVRHRANIGRLLRGEEPRSRRAAT